MDNKEAPLNPNFDWQSLVKSDEEFVKELGYDSMADYLLKAESFSTNPTIEEIAKVIAPLGFGHFSEKENGTYRHTFFPKVKSDEILDCKDLEDE